MRDWVDDANSIVERKVVKTRVAFGCTTCFAIRRRAY